MPLDTAETVLSAVDDGVHSITLNRVAKKNALTLDMYDAMTAALKNGEASDDVGCHLFLGQPGVFCAGNDIADFMKFAMSGGLGTPILEFLRTVASLEKPVMAGVDGLAIGVGTTLLFHCDYVVASDRSTFKTPFTDLGLVPEAASSLIGPRLMGPQDAYALLAMGRTFSPDDAKRARFIAEIVSPDAVAGVARAAAKEAASKPKEAMAISKRLLRGSPDEVIARIEEEAEHFAARLTSDEARQAFQAFLAKGR